MNQTHLTLRAIDRSSSHMVGARPFAWPIMAVLLALYVCAELAFNLDLVATVTQAQIDRARLDQLIEFGKFTGSFGLVLFIGRPFFARAWRRFGWGLPISFMFAWGLCYAAIDTLYSRILAQIPESIQREALYLTMYRDAVLNGRVHNIELASADGTLDDLQRLALLNLAARLTGEKTEITRIKTRLGELQALAQMGTPLEPRVVQALNRAQTQDPDILRDATAAIFLPPMSMTLSLLAVIGNLAALAGLLLMVAAKRRKMIRVVAQTLPSAAVALALVLAAQPPFRDGTQNLKIYSQLEAELGFLGWVWSRAINGEAAILNLTQAHLRSLTRG